MELWAGLGVHPVDPPLDSSHGELDLTMTVQIGDQTLRITGDMLERWEFQTPRDYHRDSDGKAQLGQAHFFLGMHFKPGHAPRWEGQG
jgi:hypothetical protein